MGHATHHHGSPGTPLSDLRLTVTITDPNVVARLMTAATEDDATPVQWLEEHLRRWWQIPVGETPPL